MNQPNTNTGSPLGSFDTGPFTSNRLTPEEHEPSVGRKKPIDKAKEQGARAVEDVTAKASEVTDTVRRQVAEATDRAKDSGRQYAEEKKQMLADEVRVFSGAIRKASKKLHEEDHDAIANYIDAAVEQLDHLSDSLQNKTLSGIVDDLQSMARRRPDLVYGGLFVCGIAAMRFLKASSPERSYTRRSRYANSSSLSPSTRRPPTAYGHAPVASPVTPVTSQERTHEPFMTDDQSEALR